jgi:hypothetical protein
VDNQERTKERTIKREQKRGPSRKDKGEDNQERTKERTIKRGRKRGQKERTIKRGHFVFS